MNGNKQKHQRKIQSPGTSFHSIFPVKVFKGTGTDPFKDHARNDQDPSTSFLLFTMIFLFLNIYYAIIFCIAELLLYIYKGILLPYPDAGVTLGIEIFVIFLLAFFEGIRLFLGYKGNLAERILSLGLSLLLAIPVLFIDLFILLWQTYVLRLEAILVCLALVLLGIEVIFTIATMITFKRHQTMLR